MTKLQWGLPGQKYYETGIEQAVLYVDGLPAVNWNGIVSVNHSLEGGENTSVYYNGEKFINNIARQEYKGSIKALFAPSEFDECVGVKNLGYLGLSTTNQARKRFNLAYKTRVGNDISGVDMGYKIHLIFNANAYVSDQTFQSVSNKQSPVINSWTISSVPVLSDGYSSTSYRVIDSRKYSQETILDLENLLYGTDLTEPSFPSAGDLTTILGG